MHTISDRKDQTIHIYRSPLTALRAAQQKLGGRIVTYDGNPVLQVTVTGTDGQEFDDYLSPADAAQQAGIRYEPPEPGL